MSHKVEIAPTGRASCRGCKQVIAKGTPRFGEEFRNPYSEEGGLSYRYWHLPCAATKMANELAPALAEFGGELAGRAEIEALVREHMKPEMPFAEHAPNGRARCRACDESIAKGELRVAFERMFEGPMGPQRGVAYAHARCLSKYLEREKEFGRETPAPADLLVTVESHSAGKLAAEALAALRAGLGMSSP
jgi:hypothetical protein